MSVTVGRLWQHAVKSMQGEEVQEVVLGPGGLLGDRAYGFLDVETERLVSAKHPKRYAPVLACRAVFTRPPSVDAPAPPVSVTFPDGSQVDGDQDEIARRLSALLGREVRMVSSVAPGVAYEEVWPALEGFGPDALADALQITAAADDEAGERIVGIPTGGTASAVGRHPSTSSRSDTGKYVSSAWRSVRIFGRRLVTGLLRMAEAGPTRPAYPAERTLGSSWQPR